MTFRFPAVVTVFVLLTLGGSPVLLTYGQDPPPPESKSADDDANDAQRREILQGERWQRTNRTLNDWLSVQRLYTPEEVTKLMADLNARIEKMSPRELETFLSNLERRLVVLMSPEATDARGWIGQFFAVARDPEAQLGRTRSDVLNMTASEIRQELQWLEQHRAARQQAQDAFDRTRSVRAQSTQQAHSARRQAQQSTRESRSGAAPQFRSPYAPSHRDLPNYTDFQSAAAQCAGRPYYTVSPWGSPVRWHPLRDNWWW